jgi:hypothetical protein
LLRAALRRGTGWDYGGQELIGPSRLRFGSLAPAIEMTVPVKKADAIRVRLFSFTPHPTPHKRLNARD